MGGKLGLGGRVALAVLLAGALLFAVVERGNADPVSYTVSIANAGTSAEGDSAGANSLSFPITVSPSAAPNDIALTYTSSEGLVQAFTIPAGTASTTLPVQINGNTSAGANRQMTVDLTGAAFTPDGSNTTGDSVSASGTGTGAITDDDWRIAGLASNPANATISEAGGGTIDFQVTLVDAANNQPKDAEANHPVTVDFALADGTGAGGAKYGQDYQTTDPSGKKSGTLTFAPGIHVVHVKVQGINDGVYGFDKQFSLTLSNPQGASFAAGATIAETGTITESSAAPIVGLTGCGTVTGGGDATFPLRTSYASPIPASVDWATSNVSTSSGDYDGGTGTATVPANSRDGSITIHTHANPPSGDRVFNLTISNGQHTTILSSAATANCTVHQPSNVGSDRLPSLQVTDPAPVAQPAMRTASRAAHVPRKHARSDRSRPRDPGHRPRRGGRVRASGPRPRRPVRPPGAPTPPPTPNLHIDGSVDANRVFQILAAARLVVHQETLQGPGPNGEPNATLFIVDGSIPVSIDQFSSPNAVRGAGYTAGSHTVKGDAPYTLWAANIVIHVGNRQDGALPAGPDSATQAAAAEIARVIDPYIGPLTQRSVTPLQLPSTPTPEITEAPTSPPPSASPKPTPRPTPKPTAKPKPKPTKKP